MTEAEWFSCIEPRLMLDFMRTRASDRKLRLFSVACCRRIWHLLDDRTYRNAVEAAEGHADGLVTDKKLKQAEVAVIERGIRDGIDTWTTIEDFVKSSISKAVGSTTRWGHLSHFAAVSARSSSEARKAVEGVDESEAQCRLLREILGNPFRAVTVDPAWLTSTVVAVARGISAEGTFECLPILADAHQEAGCENADLVDHCREPGPHVRGCWALDAILGKT